MFKDRFHYFDEELRTVNQPFHKEGGGIGIREHDGVASAFDKVTQRERGLRVRTGSHHEFSFGQTVKMMFEQKC